MLGVHPDARGRGIARSLMTTCESMARGAGKTRMTLHTTARMQGAQRMYESLGYERTEDRVFPDGFVLLSYRKDLALDCGLGRVGVAGRHDLAAGQQHAVLQDGLHQAPAELLLVQPRVQAALGEQLVVRAAFGDAAPVDHEDHVGLQDGGEAVRDGDGRAALHQRLQRGLHETLGRGVQAEVASSRIRIRGSFRMTRAIARRCFSPPESLYPRSPTMVS